MTTYFAVDSLKAFFRDENRFFIKIPWNYFFQESKKQKTFFGPLTQCLGVKYDTSHYLYK